MKWWSDELSKNEYDGVIGLSQGSAMTALLLSMVSTTSPFLIYCPGSKNIHKNSDAIYYGQLNHPEKVPGFQPQKTQPIKFAILCSGTDLCNKMFWVSPFAHISTCITGFVSNREPHAQIYGVPENLPTLHSQSDCYNVS